MTVSQYNNVALGAVETGVRRAAVIGAGTMGGGIAAQFANAGIAVDLLDIAGPDGKSFAEAGIARQLKVGGFMTPTAAGLVRAGLIDSDLGRVADADWIVEAVVENLEVKRRLYARLEELRKPGSIVSSNTSTIPRADLVEGMSDRFKSEFVITHFFNPPRVMELMELVTAKETAPAIGETARAAARNVLGKTVIACRDTPGFIANRIGCFWLAVGLLEAERIGLTVEEADAVQTAFGVPRTGVFGLIDLVGIDLIPPIWGSLSAALPAGDVIHDFDLPGWETGKALISAGAFGRKSGAGFYRKAKDGTREALDLKTGGYRPSVPAGDIPGGGKDIVALLKDEGKFGRYAASVLGHVVAYAARHAPDIAIDTADIDTAMQLGYSWRDGPLALAGEAGVVLMRDIISSLGLSVPELLMTEGGFGAKAGAPTPTLISGASEIAGNADASLRDIGDDLAVFDIHRKMNSVSPAVLDVLEAAVAHAGKTYRGLLIANDSPRAFSAGADIQHFLSMVDSADFDGLQRFIRRGQQLYLSLKYAPVPVVAAVKGVALGGGCELALHSDVIIAHGEASFGLPEANLGILPGWGGCTQTLLRAQEMASPKGPQASAAIAFELVTGAFVSGAAAEARERYLLRPVDGVVMHRDAVVPTAIARLMALVPSYQAPPPAHLTVSGHSGWLGLISTTRGNIAAGRATTTDLRVAEAIAEVLTGGENGDPSRLASEDELMQLECKVLVALAKTPETRARMAHFLKTGKPLRN